MTLAALMGEVGDVRATAEVGAITLRVCGDMARSSSEMSSHLYFSNHDRQSNLHLPLEMSGHDCSRFFWRKFEHLFSILRNRRGDGGFARVDVVVKAVFR